MRSLKPYKNYLLVFELNILSVIKEYTFNSIREILVPKIITMSYVMIQSFAHTVKIVLYCAEIYDTLTKWIY